MEHYFSWVYKCILHHSMSFRVRIYSDSPKEAVIDALWQYAVLFVAQSHHLCGVAVEPFAKCTCCSRVLYNATTVNLWQTFFNFDIHRNFIHSTVLKYIIGKEKTYHFSYFIPFSSFPVRFPHRIDRKRNDFRGANV